MATTQVKISVPGNHLMADLLGHRDELLRVIESAFDRVEIHVRGNEIAVVGDEADRVGHLFEELVLLLEQGQRLEPASVVRTIEMVRADQRPSEVLTTEVLRSGRGRTVRPKSAGQKRYVDAIRDNVITFGIGPAGTGKSWLAVAMAVQALQAKDVDRVILTRPAVEAGGRRRVPPRGPPPQNHPSPPPRVLGPPSPSPSPPLCARSPVSAPQPTRRAAPLLSDPRGTATVPRSTRTWYGFSTASPFQGRKSSRAPCWRKAGLRSTAIIPAPATPARPLEKRRRCLRSMRSP